MTSRKAGFDKSNPYRSAPKVRYVHFLIILHEKPVVNFIPYKLGILLTGYIENCA